MTTTNHNFTSSGLISITILGSSSSMPQIKRYVYLQVGKYSVRCISGIIQDDKGE